VLTLFSSDYVGVLANIIAAYLRWSLPFCSRYANAMAQIDRYLLISQKSNFVNKTSPFVFMTLITLFSFAFYVPTIFLFTIVSCAHLNTQTFQIAYVEYTNDYSDFYYSYWGVFFFNASLAVYDMLGSALLILFNILILVKFLRAMKKKKKLIFTAKSKATPIQTATAATAAAAATPTQIDSNPTAVAAPASNRKTSSSRLKENNKSEQKNTIMVITVSLITITVSILLILFKLRIFPRRHALLYTKLVIAIHLASYCVNFFLFYAFNKQFKLKCIALARKCLVLIR
jgi:hypothetical protein